MIRFPRLRIFVAAAALAACGVAGAQLLPPVQAPPVPPLVERVGRAGTDALDSATGAADGLQLSARQLARARLGLLRELVRSHPERLEMTRQGPAVRGEIVAIDPDPATLAALAAAGFSILEESRIEGLAIRTVTFGPPRGWTVDRALSRLRRIAPRGEFVANHLHLPSGELPTQMAAAAALAQGQAARPQIGIIDGGVAAHPSLRGPVEQHGFARGAPRPSPHATAVASLAAGSGPVRGAAPGAPLLVADVYGADPGGGNALAIARALGLMAERRVKVVALPLVGPSNPLVGRAVAQARARGVHIVAPVGNDGAAAPLAYPASYPGVIAVTGVDRRDRVLIEAGRAARLDYAAPGADMGAASPDGRIAAVRGTSYAVPLVAGRLAQHSGAADPVAALDREAVLRGRRGLGRGLVCGECRTPPR